ncbi:4Fe-4S binding protein [Mesosutterella sp. AGMB02718]|uniref:4Fe-4S binding protein n=1 Tax=Mesosutterella faecium TaxID=2925194 RepID=A0ABT7IN55_9BURK|nr:4Fe-4S dicluster domain-containing protein [Mesosutterella sp. AGMB02718]MDL2059809.1 4Fe-4S binding protein [Mesosutterella sp. AGMB02718]
MTQQKHKKQYAHLFNATRCIGCTACMSACANTNYADVLALGRAIPGRIMPENINRVVLDGSRRPFQVMSQCQQCADAPCIRACPFGANYRDPETGLVEIDPKRCIGCNYCIAACPYDARWSNPVTGLPSKCMGEGCRRLVAEGKDPACVSACPTHARIFGDISDPESEISEELRTGRIAKLLEHKGTKPNYFVEVSK